MPEESSDTIIVNNIGVRGLSKSTFKFLREKLTFVIGNGGSGKTRLVRDILFAESEYRISKILKQSTAICPPEAEFESLSHCVYLSLLEGKNSSESLYERLNLSDWLLGLTKTSKLLHCINCSLPFFSYETLPTLDKDNFYYFGYSINKLPEKTIKYLSKLGFKRVIINEKIIEVQKNEPLPKDGIFVVDFLDKNSLVKKLQSNNSYFKGENLVIADENLAVIAAQKSTKCAKCGASNSNSELIEILTTDTNDSILRDLLRKNIAEILDSYFAAIPDGLKEIFKLLDYFGLGYLKLSEKLIDLSIFEVGLIELSLLLTASHKGEIILIDDLLSYPEMFCLDKVIDRLNLCAKSGNTVIATGSCILDDDKFKVINLSKSKDFPINISSINNNIKQIGTFIDYTGTTQKLEYIDGEPFVSNFIPRLKTFQISDQNVSFKILGDTSEMLYSSTYVGTYFGIFENIAELFLKLPEAKARGLSKKDLLINSRSSVICSNCIDTISDSNCEICSGSLISQDLLDLKFKGLDLLTIANSPVSTLLEGLTNIRNVGPILNSLVEIGLDGVRLGSKLLSLSSSERRRVEIVKEANSATLSQFYIINHPFLSLDSKQAQLLYDFLKNKKMSAILFK